MSGRRWLAAALRPDTYGFGIRAKLITLLLALTAALGLVSILHLRVTLPQVLGEELDKRALSVARDVALRVTDPLLTANPLEVREILADTQATNPDVRYAFVLDSRGALVAHTFTGGFPRDLLTQRPLPPPGEEDVRWLRSEEGVIHDAVALIVDGLAGQVRVGLSQQHLMATLRAVERGQILTLVLACLLAVLVGYLVIWTVTARVPQLVRATQAVGRGDLTVRVAPGPTDEFGRLAEAFNQMVRDLARAREVVAQKEAARRALLQKVLSAQEEERGRISRELHDEVGQALTGLIVGLRLLEEGDEGRGQAAYLRNLAAETLESVRRLSRDLRPAVLDDMGLVAALRRYADDFARRHGISGSVQVVGDESARLPAPLETTLYRVTQEALTNVARHSQARHFGIVLDLRGAQVQLVIEDDGRGFDPSAPRVGVGLTGIAERLALVNGRMTIESSPSGGTALFVSVPRG
ncbi:signal transduction histidine kinase [Symbiobacterium terraclitae]|uniref:histidine kinase n=1 Tax=Symbiobacterium terraclitae TaxID=557451 RepID=A0ABS4JTQ2_9FIRM|nr:histidine kinase [Symbiobacterium terraclitae]MBP2018913.1 signal transduction histidine kinase [Symbiobacterium terraclitae]